MQFLSDFLIHNPVGWRFVHLSLLVPALIVWWRWVSRPELLVASSRWPRIVAWLSLAAALSISLLIAHQRHLKPPLWDFSALWMFGQVATSGLDIYDSSTPLKVYQAHGLPIEPDDGFRSLILESPVPYPPPAMAVLGALLGFFDYGTAHVFYTFACLAMLGLVALGINRTFCVSPQTPSLWASTFAILLLLPTTREMLIAEQCTFLMLLPLVMLWNAPNSKSAGFYAALFSLIKPVGAVAGALFVLKRDWRGLGVYLGTGLAALVCCIPWFGWNQVARYFVSPPYQGELADNMSMSARQSLLSTFLRLDFPSPWIWYSVSAAILGAVVAFTIWKLPFDWHSGKASRPALWASLTLLVCLGLLLYPGTWVHYGVLLTPSLFFYASRGIVTGPLCALVITVLASEVLVPTLLALLVGTLAFVWIHRRGQLASTPT